MTFNLPEGRMPGSSESVFVSVSVPENIPIPAPARLGDYLLGDLIAESRDTWTYRAQQGSMDREVVLVRQKAVREGLETLFLSDVRAKAGVDHAGIGSVYEAGQDGAEFYWTRELLQGRCFAEIYEARQRYSVRDLVGFLKELGMAMSHLEERGIRCAPLQSSDLVLGDHGVLRIKNLALAGPRVSRESARDLHTAGSLFGELLQPDVPGTDLFGKTRLTRLFHMMMGREEGISLSWTQLANTAEELEQSLAFEVRAAAEYSSKLARWRRLKHAGFLISGGALVAFVAYLFLAGGWHEPSAARQLSKMIFIPGGAYRDHEGQPGILPSFSIDAHEVTIAEYAEFLEALSEMSESQKGSHDHESQPRTKRNHFPDDWPMVLRVARREGSFQGRNYDLNHPVTGVDWWDAHAYASWKEGDLPTLRQWLAVVALDDHAAFYVDAWGPVDQTPASPGKLGIYGLVGNVAEWTRDYEHNPSFPMNAKAPVVCGGSFLMPGSGATSRNWLPSRSVRRPDLGFRIVKRMARETPGAEQGISERDENQGQSDEFALRSRDDKT